MDAPPAPDLPAAVVVPMKRPFALIATAPPDEMATILDAFRTRP